MRMVLLYIGILVAYALLDLAFLLLFARRFIRSQVGFLLSENPDLTAAGIFYLLFGAALLYFCVMPAQSPAAAIRDGAFFGLATYATYELVNKSLLANWPLPLVWVDIAWGTFAGGCVALLGFYIKKQLF